MCKADTIAKCGSRIIHHWAHAYRQNCDPWWENETQWHRDWKNLFPENCREISHIAQDGEIHRADVKTDTGIIIEFQHSAIPDKERYSRENFYGNLVWVIDGMRFKHNFDLLHLLPNPNSEIAKDIVWVKGTRKLQGAAKGMFFRLSENPKSTKKSLRGGIIQSMHSIENEVNLSYCGHHQYDWIRPHKTWFDATCPVYIDFGDYYLVRLETYDEYQLPCARLITKRKFLHDAITEIHAKDIGTNFIP